LNKSLLIIDVLPTPYSPKTIIFMFISDINISGINININLIELIVFYEIWTAFRYFFCLSKG